MKKRKITPLHLALVLFILCSLTTGVYSYMFKKTNILNNQFVPGQVSCVVNELFENNIKSNITVTNNGNTSAYIRVKVVTYWVNENDAVMAKPSKEIDFTPSNGWIKGSNDTYYYPNKIAPNESTPALFNYEIELITEDGYYQVIDVFAEAIQANPTDAVTTSWGVTLNNAAITAAP